MNKYNSARPLVMHIDLNSCFATVEQQAHVTLRGRPVGIVNRRTEHTMLVTASYEAKARGVTLGMRLSEAKKLCPDLVALESDPAKYRHVYHQLMRIMSDYSAHVRMKSIDEGVIDFRDAPEAMRHRDLKEIGYEIKQRIYDEVGDAIRCNVGIGTNRFLAKTAASLHKPNGLDEITHENLEEVYDSLKLTDLTGIAGRFEKRLNAVGIYTPREFLATSSEALEKIVFKGVVGRQWHQRLRGFEVDKRDFALKSAGRQFVLDGYKLPRSDVLQRLHHLCEEVGAKVRAQNRTARGVYVYAKNYERFTWHARYTATLPFFSDQAIYRIALQLFEQAPDEVKEIGVTCYGLEEDTDTQLGLFGDESARNYQLTDTIDDINNRYGRRTIFSADTLVTNQMVRAKIPFGSTRYM